MTRSKRRRSTRTNGSPTSSATSTGGSSMPWRRARRAHGLAHEFYGRHRLHDERRRAGVAAGHLEQVLDERLEDREVREQEVEALLAGGREFLAVLLEDRGRRGERGERRAQLVADVAREARVTLEALDQLADHVVERLGELLDLASAR